MSILNQSKEDSSMIFLIRIKCKICFIYVHKIQLQKEKNRKNNCWKKCDKRGRGGPTPYRRIHNFFSFFGTLPIVRICTLLLVKNTSKHFMLKNLWILILHLIDTSKHVMN